MVDLVKIRKKKAAKAAEAAEAAAHAGGEQAEKEASTEPAERPETNASGTIEPVSQPAAEIIPDTPAPAPAALSKLERFKAEAGKRREGDVVRTEEAAATDRLELLTFLIAGEQYAVDIERIVEIVTPRSATRIPNADESVLGIMSLRGTIVTLLDVRRKLHHRPAGAPGADTRVVVVEFNHETVGFVVDRVLRVVKTSAAEVEAHPVVHSTELDESVRGVFRVADALTILLDLDKLLDHSTLSARTA